MKILIIQNRMGIGDMVIYLPFIKAISEKFNTPVSILVKENSKAIQFLSDNKIVDKIIILDRDNKTRNGEHDGIFGSLKLINEIKKYNFEKVFIFNSSLRYYLISRFAKIKNIYQYPLFKKKNQHIIDTANKFLKRCINLDIKNDPVIEIKEKTIKEAKSKYQIDDTELNILLGIGGSGPTKRIPAKTFINLIELILNYKSCKFFLATGNNEEEQKILNEIINSKFGKRCFSLDKLSIKEILPIIKNCEISICNDSSFSHLSAALGKNTIVLMSDTPLLYGTYNSKMHPILPDGEINVSHNTLGKNKINPKKIFEKFKEILS